MKNIIFDWSGVVRDTVTNQMWIVNNIFKKYGVDEILVEEFRENWTQPPINFYQRYLPEGHSEEERAKLFRELQLDKECPEASQFTEVVKFIHKCKQKNYFLAVVSSDFPETLLPEVKDYGLENIFNKIVTGADDKLEDTQRIIEENNLDLTQTYFIGDSNHEIDVSRKVGIKSIAVTWGFTDKSKLMTHNPDYVVDSVQGLEDILLK